MKASTRSVRVDNCRPEQEGTPAMIYEERRTILKRGALTEYTALMLDHVWPGLTAIGIRPLCLLNGLIGLPATETYCFSGYTDAGAWERLQAGPESSLRRVLLRRWELIEEEQVRLLQPSEVRPKVETPVADRRAIYGLRRFSIRSHDWPDFVQHSAGGIWPRIETQGACILGLFHNAGMTDPLEVTLLTGYRDASHWDATRGWREKPDEMPEDLWQHGQRAAAGRNAITLRSHVYLMTAHWPAGG